MSRPPRTAQLGRAFATSGLGDSFIAFQAGMIRLVCFSLEPLNVQEVLLKPSVSYDVSGGIIAIGNVASMFITCIARYIWEVI